ncbi:MAG: hypothetical protein RhofKO_10340 [Rhodothermales bacterium]
MRRLLRHLIYALAWLLPLGAVSTHVVYAQDYTVEPPRFIFDDVDKGYDLIFRPDHIVRVQWPADYNLTNATIRWARSPADISGSARQATAQAGNAFIEFTPAALSMDVGQWYGQVDADQGTSNVFFIYVESLTPPTATVLNPESEVPTFEVTPVPGVPAYGIGVSDTPFTVRLDPDGDLAVDGLSLIWRYVGSTGETSIPYAKDAVNPVPLEQGRTYYYIVFNAYEPSDVRFLSSVNAGVFTFTNGIDASTLNAPVLSTPRAGATLTDETIRFTWDAVDNGDRYKVTVLQEYELLGSTGEIEVWSTTVVADGEGGQQLAADFNARRVLTRDTYRWFVSVESLTLGESKASERRAFEYIRPVANLALTIQQVGGQPLTGVQVAVASDDFVPRDGQLDVQNATQSTFELPLGTYTLTFSKESYRTTTITVMLDAEGSTISEVVQLPALTTAIQGRVRDPDGQPIFGATVTAVSSASSDRADAEGVYQVFLEQGGALTLRAEATGFAAAERTVSAVDGGTTTGVDFTLMPDRATVSGRVTTTSGRSLALATIQATHTDGRQVTTRTDGEGAYALTLSSGTWRLEAEVQGFQQAQASLTLGTGQDITQDFRLEVAQQEAIVVVRNAAGPLSDAIITTMVDGSRVTQQTDAQGEARFSLASGQYAFRVSATGHAPQTVYRTLTPSMTLLTVPVRLDQQTALLQGQVVDPRGRVDGATMHVYQCNQPRPALPDEPADAYVGTASFTCAGGVQRVATTQTSSAGVYQLQLPRPPGGTYPAYLLQAHHASGERGRASDLAFPTPGAELTTNFTLPVGAGRLSGQVQPRSIRTLRSEQIAVVLRPVNGTQQYVAHPDADGRFELAAPYGEYTVQAVDRQGIYATAAPQPIQFRAGQTLPALTLEVADRTVLWSGTVNVPQAQITLARGEATYTTQAAANGVFGIRVPPGPYHVLIRSEGWLPERTFIEVESAQSIASASTTTSFTLRRAATAVRGTIRSTDGAVLEGVAVQVTANGVPSDTVFTDPVGRYTVDAEEGLLRLTAQHPGFASAEQQVLLALGQPVTGIDLVLQARLASVTGSIRDDANVPVAGSRVVLLSTSGGGRTLSETDGAVTLTGLAPATYTLGITNPGYETITLQNIPLQQGFNPLAVRQTRQRAQLEGAVRTTDAEPVAEAAITVTYADGTTVSTLTANDGTYHFDTIAAGEVTVSASKVGFSSASGAQTITLTTGQQSTVNFEDFVRVRGRITGAVRSASDQPLAGVTVTAERDGQTTSAQTDTEGAYALDNLSEGTYRLTAQRTGFADATASVTLTANTTLTQDFTLEPNTGRITGQVVDQDGAVLGFPVEVVAASAAVTRTAITNDAGQFTLTGLAIGTTYTVRTNVATEGYVEADASVDIPISGEASVTLEVVVNTAEISGEVGTEGATIDVIDVATDDVVRSIPVTSQGAYRATLLPAGTYRVRPRRVGFVFTPASREVTVAKAGQATASFTASSVQATLIVLAEAAGTPLPDVQVTVASTDGTITQEATTNAEGVARFPSLTGGLSYTVGATRAGFQTSPSSRTVALAVGATESITFTLTESTARISGTVRSEGAVLPGARLTATVSSGALFTATQPDEGPYALTNLPAGTYTVQAQLEGYRTVEQSLTLADGETRASVDFDLIPERVRLTGRVVYAGEGLSEVEVVATGPFTRSARTDASGRYTITAPLSGSATDTTVYVVGIGGGGTLPRRTAVVKLTGTDIGATVPLPDFVVPSGQVAITLTDGVAPLPNTVVQFVSESGQLQTGRTDAGGRFTSSATLEQGTYTVAITAPTRLLPEGDLLRIPLASDTDRVTRTIALPYQLVVPSTISSTEPTPIRIAFPANFDPADADARVTYQPTSTAPSQTLALQREADAFAGTIPATFSLDAIEIAAEVRTSSTTYRSATRQLTPTRSGVLGALQVTPNLNDALLRPNDPYVLTLQLFDGLGEPLLLAPGQGTITWTGAALQIDTPAVPAPTTARIIALQAGTYTLTVQVNAGGIERRRSFQFQVVDARISEVVLAAPVTRLHNASAGTRLAFTGLLADGTGLTLGEQVRWTVSPSTAGEVDASGFFRPTDAQFIGPVMIQLDDPLSGLQAQTSLNLFARVDATQDYILTNGPHLALTLPQGAIPFPAEIGLANGSLGPAKQQVFDAERRAFRVAAPTYHVQFRANQALPGDSLAADAALAVQFIARDTLGTEAVALGRFNPAKLQWSPYADSQTSTSYVTSEQVRRLGEFGVLLQTTPLGISHAAVLPSPFSPDVGVAKVGYILSSTAPPARVDVTVYNLQGERIRTLLADDPQLPGRYGGRTSLQPIQWDGRTDNGQLARNGRYVIRIRARDSSGEVTQLLPVVLVK